MVGFLSQIGWTENDGESPQKQIQMEKILVDVDMNGGNSLISRLHNKIPHRESVIDNIINYLAG